jgi:UDP-N-acetylglucosamine 2-epimerase
MEGNFQTVQITQSNSLAKVEEVQIFKSARIQTFLALKKAAVFFPLCASALKYSEARFLSAPYLFSQATRLRVRAPAICI